VRERKEKKSTARHYSVLALTGGERTGGSGLDLIFLKEILSEPGQKKKETIPEVGTSGGQGGGEGGTCRRAPEIPRAMLWGSKGEARPPRGAFCWDLGRGGKKKGGG